MSTSPVSNSVLVIEDDPKNAALTTVLLQIAGISRVRVCLSGAEIKGALDELQHVDLVLLDIRLPNEDGYQILQRLRKEPVCRTTPIVAMTAEIMPESLARAEAAGFDGFLGKPLNFDRFRSQIARMLAGERVWEPR